MIRGLIAAVGAVVALALAGLMASIAPASECSSPQTIHVWAAAPFFAVFLALGCYVVVAASISERLTLFLGSSLVIAAYVAGLALSLPMVIEGEISCSARGQR